MIYQIKLYSYTVNSDGTTKTLNKYIIHDSTNNELRLVDPKVSIAVNTVGSFTFTIYPDHPHYDKIEKLAYVKIFQYPDDDLTKEPYILFVGRIIKEETGFYNQISVTCEDAMGFFFDTVVAPFTFTGSTKTAVRYFVDSKHNTQVGSNADYRYINFNADHITVKDTDVSDNLVRSSEDYMAVYDVLDEKLFNSSLGGYMFIKYDSTGNNLYYLASITEKATQSIDFGKNLLDYKLTINADDFATCIVPLGVKDDDGNRLTIKSVTESGVDYISDSALVKKYGEIRQIVVWDDVTIASNLLTKAQAKLADISKAIVEIEVTAADLSATDTSIEEFKLGTKVKVKSIPHNLDEYMDITKLSIDIQNPANNRVVLTQSKIEEDTTS